MDNKNLPLMAHYFSIKVYTKLGGDLVCFKKWHDLRFELATKYNWYFKYRAALLQVQYPKYLVVCNWGPEEATKKTLLQLEDQKIITYKAKITKYQNRLNDYKQQFELYKKNYYLIFPIENETLYKNFIGNIELAEARIKKLQNELDQLQNNKKV